MTYYNYYILGIAPKERIMINVMGIAWCVVSILSGGKARWIKMFFEEEVEVTPFNLREVFIKGLKERFEQEEWNRWNKKQEGKVEK